MKKFLRIFAVLLCCALLVPVGINTAVPSDAADGDAYYIATNGDDSADGSSSHPFATISGAQKAIRSRIASGDLPKGGITVYMRGGVYTQTEQIVFTAEDSGTDECPITWMNEGSDEVIITGGVRVKGSDFTDASAEAKARLIDQDAAKNLKQLSLSKVGASSNPHVYFGDTVGFIARVPNDDFFQIFSNEALFNLPDSDCAENWSSYEGARIRGYLEIDYFISEGNVVGLDKNAGTVKVDQGVSGLAHYYYYNIMDEMDAPGEYYVDGDTLYVIPTENFSTCDITLSGLSGQSPFNEEEEGALFIGKDAHNLTFRGLTVEGTQIGAFSFDDCNSITIDSCVIRNLDSYAVYLHGFNNRVINNHMYNLGTYGINIGGSDKANIVPGNNLIDNNHIHDFSLLGGTYAGAVNFADTWDYGVTVSHNLIHGTKHVAISGGYSDCVVEYNVIYDVCREANDAGAIYTGRYEAQEQIYRYNLIYDVKNVYGFGSPNAIYVDDGGGYKIAYGNIFYNIGGSCFAMSGGPNNQIYNNIMINSGGGVTYDSRQYAGNNQEQYANYADGLIWKCMLAAPGFRTRNWMMRYPRVTLVDISNVRISGSRWALGSFGLIPVRGNLFAGCKSSVSTQGVVKQMLSLRDNLYYGEASKIGVNRFDDLEALVADGSALYKQITGFEKIDFSSIGLRK